MAWINLTQLSNWDKLSRVERYWAGYCARKLSDSERVLEWRPNCPHQVLLRGPGPGSSIRELYALDSLMCALTVVESKYAFYALLQARGYISEGKFDYLNDCYGVAKARVETMLEFWGG